MQVSLYGVDIKTASNNEQSLDAKLNDGVPER